MEGNNMGYALNLADDGRILSATAEKYRAAGQPIVLHLPDGDISDYIYQNGHFILSPLPKPAETPDHGILISSQIDAIVARNEFLEDCIAEMAQIIYN